MPPLPSRLALFAFGALVGAALAVRWVTRSAGLITPPGLAPLLLDPLRMRYRNPSAVIQFANVQPDWIVLDLGCGNGAFTLELAKCVRIVHAVDVQPAMLEALERRLAHTNVPNVRLHLAPATHLPFDAETFDAVLMISVLPMLHDRATALGEVRRVLKPGGVLIVGEELIEPEYVSDSVTMRWVERAGFRLTKRDVNLLRYTLKFERTETRNKMKDDK